MQNPNDFDGIYVWDDLQAPNPDQVKKIDILNSKGRVLQPLGTRDVCGADGCGATNICIHTHTHTHARARASVDDGM